MKIIILFLISFSLNAKEYEWTLQITKPDFDMIYIPLKNEKFKPFLEKTGWRCWFSKTQIKNHIHSKNIKCDFSVQKAGQFSTTISCNKDRPYGELVFDLKDERKNIEHKIMVTCREKK